MQNDMHLVNNATFNSYLKKLQKDYRNLKRLFFLQSWVKTCDYLYLVLDRLHKKIILIANLTHTKREKNCEQICSHDYLQFVHFLTL
jgi:hypothetical protein